MGSDAQPAQVGEGNLLLVCNQIELASKSAHAGLHVSMSSVAVTIPTPWLTDTHTDAV